MPLVLGVIPWMVYAVAMWDLNHQDRPDADITVGIDHYSVQGAYRLALLGLVTLAALWPAARAYQRAGPLQWGHAGSFSSFMAFSTPRARS